MSTHNKKNLINIKIKSNKWNKKKKKYTMQYTKKSIMQCIRNSIRNSALIFVNNVQNINITVLSKNAKAAGNK